MPKHFEEYRKKFQAMGDRKIAQGHQRFFKTGPGEYAEGDQFLGIRTPAVRRHVRGSDELHVREVRTLLRSAWHEERLLALLILVRRFSRSPDSRQGIFDLYLEHTNCINNWDLVDSSAAQIVGGWLIDQPRTVLSQLVASDNLWERRIAIMASWTFIRQNDLPTTIHLARQLLNDEHDLIHKATGWMLREVGKRNLRILETFLHQHGAAMPRTMLRYAIEKMSSEKRKMFLALKKA